MRKVTLKFRDVVDLLTHNGFESLGRKATSHIRYTGVIDGQTLYVDLDEKIADYSPASHAALSWIVSAQLKFFGPGVGPAKDGWRRFYAGEPRVARMAQVEYCKWESRV